MRINHVRLLVVNFAECFCFYRDIIGLTVIWGNEADDYAAFAEKGNKVPNLALFRRRAMAEALGTSHLPSDVTSQDRSILIIGVADVDVEVTRMLTLGAQFVVGPQDYPDWGMRSAYLRDADGNLLELTSDLPPERWSPGLREAAQQYV
jgi:catechol 2,3-dioxygenase-like lactoylglutathione lyase family enzyme